MDVPPIRPRHDRVDRDVAVAVGLADVQVFPGSRAIKELEFDWPIVNAATAIDETRRLPSPTIPARNERWTRLKPDLDVAIGPDQVSGGRCGWVVDGEDRAVRVVGRDATCQVAARAREEPVLFGVEAGSLAHLGRLRRTAGPGPDVPRRRDRTRVGRVLLGAPDREREPEIDDERGDDEQRHETAGEDDEDLAGFAVWRAHAGTPIAGAAALR